MAKEKTLFDKLYGATEEALKFAKKGTVRARLKRKLNSSYDDAGEQILDLEAELGKVREDFNSYDVNDVTKIRLKQAKLKDLQAVIKGEFDELFGKAGEEWSDDSLQEETEEETSEAEG